MKNFFLAVAVFVALPIFSQILPHYATAVERSQMPDYVVPLSMESDRTSAEFFNPPTTPVRTMAEWEESQGYLIAWTSYPAMLREIVRYGKQECRMYVLTNNAASVISDLQSNGIDTAQVSFLNLPFNSVWSRDYGQWCVYTNEVDSLLFIDWIYNRNRPKDDTVPVGLANYLNVPVYHTTQGNNKLVNTGGNFMCDGQGTGFASKLILTDNLTSAGFGVNHTEAEIDTIMKNFMGIDRYIKMETLPYDDIHHIDMHLKLLNEETLMVGQYPPGTADGPQIEANLQYVLSHYHSVFGTPYKVVRIPMPPDNGQYPPSNFANYYTYTNASFINKTIIVPTYGIPEDSTALRIWREACPGYKVVGINSSSSIPSLGALHCITKEIGVSDPLLIIHQQLSDTYNTATPYAVKAKIEHRSGIQSATLYYTTDTTQAYHSIPMTAIGNDRWQGEIPAQMVGTEVFYYIQAQAHSGKQQVRPIVAPLGFFHFKVLGTTGISEVAENEQIEVIFPNPSKGMTCLPVKTERASAIAITCINVLGKTVQQIFKGTTLPGENKFFLNTSTFAAGVYFIRYSIEERQYTRRLVVR